MPALDDAMFYRICRSLLPKLAKVYAELATGGNHSEAGRLIGLNGQVLGRVLGELEKALPEYFGDLPLIDRSQPSGYARTEAGERLLVFINDVRERSGLLIDDLQRIKHATNVRVAIIHSVWHAFHPDWQAAFQARAPEGMIEYEHIEQGDWARRIFSAVESGAVDVGITSSPGHVPESLEHVPLTPHPFMLVLPVSHPYAPVDGRTAVMNASHFAADRFVLYEPHEGYLRSSKVYEYLTRRCHVDLSKRTRVITRARFVECKELVEQGEGISILPYAVVRRYIKEGSRIKTFSLNPVMRHDWQWSLVRRRTNSRPIVQRFIESVVAVDRQVR